MHISIKFAPNTRFRFLLQNCYFEVKGPHSNDDNIDDDHYGVDDDDDFQTVAVVRCQVVRSWRQLFAFNSSTTSVFFKIMRINMMIMTMMMLMIMGMIMMRVMRMLMIEEAEL